MTLFFLTSTVKVEREILDIIFTGELNRDFVYL